MKQIIVLTLSLFALTGKAFNSETKQSWQLEWAEEFNGSGLPDSKKWDYEKGLIRNNESQYYQKKSLKNSRLENGKLIVEAHRENVANSNYQKGSKDWRQREKSNWSSASVITLGKKEFLYGRIEVRAKMTQGRGSWPAIWMMGVNRSQVKWPYCGEIDILEFLGKDPKTVHSTVHFFDDKKQGHKSNGSHLKHAKLSSQFHIYAIEWDKDKIDFFINDKKVHSFTIKNADRSNGENPFRKPHYLLINLAMGGSWSGPIDPKLKKVCYEVDYVRYYKKNINHKNK